MSILRRTVSMACGIYGRGPAGRSRTAPPLPFAIEEPAATMALSLPTPTQSKTFKAPLSLDESAPEAMSPTPTTVVNHTTSETSPYDDAVSQSPDRTEFLNAWPFLVGHSDLSGSDPEPRVVGHQADGDAANSTDHASLTAQSTKQEKAIEFEEREPLVPPSLSTPAPIDHSRLEPTIAELEDPSPAAVRSTAAQAPDVLPGSVRRQSAHDARPSDTLTIGRIDVTVLPPPTAEPAPSKPVQASTAETRNPSLSSQLRRAGVRRL